MNQTMMGRNHVLSGAVAGTLTLQLVDLPSPVLEVGWVILVAGAVLIPDWDSASSSATTMWGPVSEAIHAVVALISGGHRWGTHDAILAPAAVAGLALLARQHPLTSSAVIAVAVGLMIQGLTTSRVITAHPVINLSCSIAAALLPTVAGDLQPLVEVMPAALAMGVLVAIAGDFITEEGVPVPLVWIVRRCRFGLGLFRVDGLVENTLVSALLGLALLAAVGQQVGLIAALSALP